METILFPFGYEVVEERNCAESLEGLREVSPDVIFSMS